MNYVKLIFEIQNADDADILSALLEDKGVLGFEQNETQLITFFKENEFDEEEIKNALLGFSLVYTKEITPHENWNLQWESNFEPIRLNNEVGVRANFHLPFTDCKYDIVITPKMSFGTGHHETTQMMLEYISETDCVNKSVFDFGCGTAVLAIFAKLKGANYVAGIDNDEWCVENSIENCATNGCESIEISLQPIEAITNKFDIIVANINLNVLLDSLAKMKTLLNPNGKIMLSGILVSDIKTITECLQSLGFIVVSQKQKKDWVALMTEPTS